MNLLYCAGCRHAFTEPDGGQSGTCVVCGGVPRLIARDVLQVSPLRERDDGPALAGTEATAAGVALRRRQSELRGDLILRKLSSYFQVVATDGGAQVSVDRSPPIDAPWRVAAVLDGIDQSWEEHFFLPELDASERDAGI